MIAVRRSSEGVFRVALMTASSSPVLDEAIFQIECEDKDLNANVAEILESLRSFDLLCTERCKAFVTENADSDLKDRFLRQLLYPFYPVGGDREAAALIEVLAGNHSLKMLTINCFQPSPVTVMGIAQMLAFSSTLESVEFRNIRGDPKALLFLEEHFCGGVFKRLRIVWPMGILSELAMLVRTQSSFTSLSVVTTRVIAEREVREFFDAVASNTTLRELSVWVNEEESIFYTLPCSPFCSVLFQRAARVVCGRHTEEAEWQLVTTLDALKKNHTIRKFAMRGVLAMTPQIATSLSELLAASNTLNHVDISSMEIQPREIETLLQGLRVNYTLTNFTVCRNPDGSKMIRELQAILKRNVTLELKAAQAVTAGVSDEEGMDALKRLHSAAGLVEKVQQLTGKNTEAAFEQIQSTLARLSL
ncbi:hypothetical protein HPB50_009672 [Hyalomma asiaticum]|uniref:Uncharacterized protein n=1 Tax=Hyalomma asiaticum TaxID=266040 RepID=A0ACB7RML4_HYAAI|nr:hypothetical protein HPB50_009672 [Hyalomma asiaticum]